MRSPLADEAVAGITDPRLAAVVGDHWEHMMKWAPTYATTLGDHRFDGRLAPRHAQAIAEMRAERDRFIAALEAIDAGALGDSDGVTHGVLLEKLVADRGLDVVRMHEWRVDSGGSSLFGELSYIVECHTVKTDDDAEKLINRMMQAAQIVNHTIGNLEAGLAAGLVAGREKVKRAIAQLDTELDKPTAEWAMAKPKWAITYPSLAEDLVEVIERGLRSAFKRYRELLHDRILPKARVEIEGLASLPNAAEMYRATIREHVGLDMSAESLHELGIAEIARTDRELAELGKTVLGMEDLAQTIERLRSDPTLYFTSREEILDVAQDCLDRAKAATPKMFRTLPKTDCVMREVPAYEAPYSTIAYYRQPHYDGSKPGEYFVNTYQPETRPRFELEALSWHEAIPGHHTQIALAMELGAVPMIRKLDGCNAYVEGWALYTERLADELGLYSSDLDRIGKLSYDAWRASRLVVDTGLHHFGWTRAQAENYMREHTALTVENISNEVDRYIGWPGQALSYKVGQLKILELRATSQQKLGPRFDMAGFHDVVLGAGAVTLPILERRVNAWIALAPRGNDDHIQTI